MTSGMDILKIVVIRVYVFKFINETLMELNESFNNAFGKNS